ncbi:MAG: germination protein YpeB [Clostridia bacterium]|nr:germination protein YpeB [Clostridia bacterium]
MKRRNIVRVVSFLCAVIVVLTGVIIKNYKNAQRLELQIENSYSRSLNEFSASINNISLILKKARYTSRPEVLAKMAAEILTEAEISKSALAELPSIRGLDSLNLFLSQAGNYAFAVSTKLYNGGEVPKDFENNIRYLSETAQKISQVVSDTQIGFDNREYWVKEIKNEIDANVSESLNGDLQKLEDELSDYPTLIYDGPYSESLTDEEPEMLKNADYITEDTAIEKAYEFFGEDNKFQVFGEISGDIEAFRIGNSDTDIAISKKGGYPVYFRKYRQIEKTILSYSQALTKAKRFLSSRSLNNFLENYYYIDEGVCVINFAYLDGETICYTDLIKVGIAMDSGEVMFYEASGFLSNHKSRAFETAKYTEEQAKERVSKNLKINKVSKTLIPTEAGEKRCYEFLCSDDDTEVLVYINVLDLKQEDILILLKNDGGTLAK